MSQTDKTISINVSVSHIRETLRSFIKHPFADKMTDVIIGNLNHSEVGLQQLLLVFGGMVPMVSWKPGDDVSVSADDLSYWSMDKEKMTEEKMIFQGRVRAEVISIDLYKNKQVKVSYKYLDKTGQEKSDTNDVSANKIAFYEQAPADQPDSPDDLPF